MTILKGDAGGFTLFFGVPWTNYGLPGLCSKTKEAVIIHCLLCSVPDRNVFFGAEDLRNYFTLGAASRISCEA